MSSVIIPKEHLTAFERWELASFDQNAPANPTISRKAALAASAAETAAAELEGLRQQAQSDGYKAGYAEGTKAARQETLRIQAVMQNLQNSINQVDEKIAQSLLDLSLEIANKMVREIVQAKPEVILSVINDAIANLPLFNQNAHLLLHPDDAELVRTQMGEQLSHAGWKIFADAKIQRGGCRVETEHSQVDATVEARWKHVVESIGRDTPWQA
ncbi:MAG: flagellar assembly protein FliH [Gallionella sp.]|nr:flagellar assembly protein FliH [Gallionella sp.]